MIRNILLSASILILALSLSCTAPLLPGPASNSTPVSLSATINGSTWSSTTGNGADNGANGIAINTSPIANNKTTIGLVIPSSNPGFYSYGSGTMMSIDYMNDSSIIYITSSGSITVTSFSNKVITGTFQGTCTNFTNSKDVIFITNGKFTAQLK